MFADTRRAQGRNDNGAHHSSSSSSSVANMFPSRGSMDSMERSRLMEPPRPRPPPLPVPHALAPGYYLLDVIN